MRRAISPVIATVIIVAVAIAISIAVAGWLMGLWGGFGQTESLKIFPDSYAAAVVNNDTTSNYLVLHVQNVGGSPAEIYKIEISGEEITSANTGVVDKLNQDPGQNNFPNTFDDLPVTLNPGEEAWLVVKLAQTQVASGAAYTVTIYTEAGNVYTTTVYGK